MASKKDDFKKNIVDTVNDINPEGISTIEAFNDFRTLLFQACGFLDKEFKKILKEVQDSAPESITITIPKDEYLEVYSIFDELKFKLELNKLSFNDTNLRFIKKLKFDAHPLGSLSSLSAISSDFANRLSLAVKGLAANKGLKPEDLKDNMTVEEAIKVIQEKGVKK